MKIKTYKTTKPFHLHVEHVSRTPIILAGVLGLLMLGIAKADSKMLGRVHDAYAEGYSVVGSYLRNETVHPLEGVAVSRIPTTSGQ